MSFAGDVKNYTAKAKATTLTEARRIALELFRRVILKTPVDTGRARANWQFFIGDPVPTEQTELDKSGSRAINRAMSGLQAMQLGNRVWLANNLPYIRALEYGEYPNPPKSGTKTEGGFSKQAPQGMVRVTVAEFGSIVEKT